MAVIESLPLRQFLQSQSLRPYPANSGLTQEMLSSVLLVSYFDLFEWRFAVPTRAEADFSGLSLGRRHLGTHSEDLRVCRAL
jgi:hypothetical protein